MTHIDSLLAPNQPWIEVISVLQRAGHKAFLVGGCVRDLLLGLKTKDADVATSARPEQVEALFQNTIPVGKAFGVIVVLVRSQPIEVATFRRDDAYVDGRHPTAVHFSDETEDARRRDFTINALYLDPVGRTILDPVSGKRDLSARLIRAVGDPAERFSEDRLRILRAIRFQARLGFRIHPATQRAIRAFSANLEGISPERIRGELSRMLTESNPALAFQTLARLGPLASVLPQVARVSSLPSAFSRRRRTRLHDLLAQMLWLKPQQETVAWALLLSQCAATQGLPVDRVWHRSSNSAIDVLRGFNSSKQLADDVGTVLRNLSLLYQASSLDLAAKKHILLGPAATETLEAWRILALAHHTPWLRQWQEMAHLFSLLKAQPPQLSDWVTGHDLASLGYAPGPIMGRILRALEQALLNESLHTREEALAFVQANFPLNPTAPPASALDPNKR